MEETRILLIGKTGSGKSSTANLILGKRSFTTSLSQVSITNSPQCEETIRNGRRLVIVDTPGFYDTERSNDEIVKDIIKIFAFLSPGFHALLFILNPGRFTKECLAIQNLFFKRFGPEAANYTIIILTRADDLERNGKTLQQYLKEGSKDFLQFLKTCGNRIIAFNNFAQGNAANRQIDQLMALIDDIALKSKSCFTNNHLRLVKTFLKLDRKLKHKRLENARVALFSKAVCVLGIEKASVWNYRDNKPKRILVKAKTDISPLVNLRVLPPVGSKASKNIQVVPLKNPMKKPDSENEGKSTNEPILIRSVPTMAELQSESRHSPIRTCTSDFKDNLSDENASGDTGLLSDNQASENGSAQSQNESQEQLFSLKYDIPDLKKNRDLVC